jgi:hypothetical protein
MAVVKNDDAKTMPVNRIVDKVAIATEGGTMNLRNYGGGGWGLDAANLG